MSQKLSMEDAMLMFLSVVVALECVIVVGVLYLVALWAQVLASITSLARF